MTTIRTVTFRSERSLPRHAAGSCKAAPSSPCIGMAQLYYLLHKAYVPTYSGVHPFRCSKFAARPGALQLQTLALRFLKWSAHTECSCSS